ncbi:hypothetical protein BKA65DRAFT_508010 [Rhexocercosporidium sp. MPI-PUGE-AT-0058]|nr:hypothetical protein BKA65DRAFT_508010 [Rhexocercosporidium sp. MPI-PUGE-AT-0058]
MLGGMVWFWIASDALRTPAKPAQPSRWPITVLIDPTRSLRGGISKSSHSLGGKKASRIACASTGSPACVPVPWASKNWHYR